MNGKKARALRRSAFNRKHYQALKREAKRGDGQNPKPLPERRRKPMATAAPSWPRGANQRAQSRPLIVIHPVRALCPGSNTSIKAWHRKIAEGAPKWQIDRAALRGMW